MVINTLNDRLLIYILETNKMIKIISYYKKKFILSEIF